MKIIEADYSNSSHGDAIIEMMNTYAKSPTGGESPLSQYTRENLVDHLDRIPSAFTLIAFDENTPTGLANCFEAFSTFACRPIINIHDLIVMPEFRRKGIAENLLMKVQHVAEKRNACKITLEVLEGNKGAQSLYKKYGFSGYELTPEMGKALFWEKKI